MWDEEVNSKVEVFMVSQFIDSAWMKRRGCFQPLLWNHSDCRLHCVSYRSILTGLTGRSRRILSSQPHMPDLWNILSTVIHDIWISRRARSSKPLDHWNWGTCDVGPHSWTNLRPEVEILRQRPTAPANIWLRSLRSERRESHRLKSTWFDFPSQSLVLNRSKEMRVTGRWISRSKSTFDPPRTNRRKGGIRTCWHLDVWRLNPTCLEIDNYSSSWVVRFWSYFCPACELKWLLDIVDWIWG